MDKVTLKRIQTLHPSVRKEVEQIYTEICTVLNGRATVRFTHTLRTDKEQRALFAQGRNKLDIVNSLRKEASMSPITLSQNKIVTKAKEWQSIHNYGFAIDIVLIIDNKEISYDINKDYDNDKLSDWKEVVNIFKKYKWIWGGDWKSFKDYPHFEKSPLSLTELNKKRLNKEFIENTTYVKI